MSNLIQNLKNISIIVFFISLTWSVFTLTNSFERKTDLLIVEANKTSLLVKDSINLVEKKISSIEEKTFNQLKSIEINSIGEVSRLNDTISSVASSISNVSGDISNLTNEHTQLTKGANVTVSRVNELLDCTNNDLCWPNLTTDVLIDTRNMVRDGSKTFRMVNSNIPKVVGDFNKVSTSLSDGVPKFVQSTTAVSSNIEKITRPKWYDKVISWGVNGSLLYFNINRGMLKQ